MKRIKNIGFMILWIIIIIIKLPFYIMSEISMLINYLIVKGCRWLILKTGYDDEDFISGWNWGSNYNAETYEALAEIYEDMGIEIE